jgi:hypothetical protein
MNDQVRVIELGGVRIPLLSSLNLTQDFSSTARETILPMGDGTLVKQTLSGSEDKVEVSISATGPVPTGLQGLDFTGFLLFKSATPMAISKTNASITIPSARRSDGIYVPWGRAFVDDAVVLTPVAMDEDVATLTPVTGAQLYQCLWYPQFNVFTVDGIRTTFDEWASEARWNLTLRQI